MELLGRRLTSSLKRAMCNSQKLGGKENAGGYPQRIFCLRGRKVGGRTKETKNRQPALRSQKGNTKKR